MNIWQQLQCPKCYKKENIYSPLLIRRRAKGEVLKCNTCQQTYLIKNKTPIFVEQEKKNTVTAHTSKPSAFKKILKILLPPRHSLDFNTFQSSHKEGKELIDFLQRLKEDKTNNILSSHNLPDGQVGGRCRSKEARHATDTQTDKEKQTLKQNIATEGSGGPTIINIGSLSKNLKKIHPNIFNLDIIHYPNTDIVADAHHLPFKDSSIDMIIFKNVLEHIKTPQIVMNEIYRVLKPGGYLYTKIPFLQPFHSVPDDYQRYSLSGFRELHKKYAQINQGIAVGPGSMLSWMAREWLAILTSLGNMKLYKAGLIFWGWLTFWIKYFDLIFKHNKLSHRLTSAFFGIYQKKKEEA